jgi:hypothetical protein
LFSISIFLIAEISLALLSEKCADMMIKNEGAIKAGL